MSVLDQVIALKNKGVPESDIIANLREQGVSPGLISEALSQARIKDAVSAEGNGNGSYEEGMEPSIMRPEKAEPLPTEGEISDVDLTPPTPGMYRAPGQRAVFPLHKEVGEEEYASEETYMPQVQQYPQYQSPEFPQYQSPELSPEYEYTPSATDTDTAIEIAEQVFLEKIKPMQKQVEDLSEFRVLFQSRVENISERLKRIESSIDRLQAEILEKVGSYGRGLDSVQKEMSMMQDSFGKALGTIASKAEQKHHTPHAKSPTQTVQKIEKKTTVVHKSHKAGKHKK